MESKVPEAQADKETDPKNQNQQPSAQWNEIFRGAWHDLSPGYMPNIVVTLIASLFTPVLGVVMNSQKTIVVGVALALTIAIWGSAIAVIRRLPQSSKGESAPTPEAPPPPTPAPTLDPFSVSILAVIAPDKGKKVMYSPFWYSYDSKSGQTISPVAVGLFIQVVNPRRVPFMVESYSVEAQNKKGEWIKLLRMNTRMGAIFRVNNNDFSKALRIDFGANGFDNLIASRSIPPHETVRGWAFFGIPEDISPTPRFRFLIRDTAGQEATFMPSVEPAPDAAQEQAMLTQEAYDISRLPKKFYGE